MRVILNEADHTYTDERGQYYKSVSSVIAQYKQPFDPYKIMVNGQTLIANYVAKHGFSEQYWLDNWAGKRDYACEKGHAFHYLKEMYVNNQAFVKARNRFMPVQNQNQQWMIKTYEGLFGQLKPGVYTELCIWNALALLAGTADLVTIYPDRTFDIDDYKTNGEFKTESFQGRPMKFPCINLMDCHLGHYTLQLNLYAWMLAQFGLTPNNLRILHYDIPEDKVEQIVRFGVLPEIEPTVYEIGYDEDLALAIINNRKHELIKKPHYGFSRSKRAANRHRI